MNALFTEKNVTVKERTYDHEKIIAEINNYLDENRISNKWYKATRVENNMPSLDTFTIYLERVNGDVIDEDFTGDDAWTEFCNSLAKRLRVRRCSVPLYYLPK